jgi:hypothetical protein
MMILNVAGFYFLMLLSWLDVRYEQFYPRYLWKVGEGLPISVHT